MKRKKFITESILYISFGMLSGCSTENVAINDFMSHSQSSNLEFTDIEYKVLSNISKPRKIEPDEAKAMDISEEPKMIIIMATLFPLLSQDALSLPLDIENLKIISFLVSQPMDMHG